MSETEPIFDMSDPAFQRVYAEESALIEASEVVAKVMEKEDVTRSALARTLGVSRSEITTLLSGNRNMTLRKLAATLDALGWRLQINATPGRFYSGSMGPEVMTTSFTASPLPPKRQTS